MSAESVEKFTLLLKKSPPGALFNPWWEVDNENDIGRNAPAIRRKQLRAYLQERLRKATLAVIGEAVGYRGGHFSGIPMTSERLLLGRNKRIELSPSNVLSDLKPRRTSKPEKYPTVFPNRRQRLSGAHCCGSGSSQINSSCGTRSRGIRSIRATAC